MTNSTIREIDWNEILPVWQLKLWPNRKSKIEKTSAMTFDGSIDMSFMIEDSLFLGAFVDDTLVGVNSGHRAGINAFRSRGLYVDPLYRGNGIASSLLARTILIAALHKCTYVWTIPRKSSLPTYERAGFVKCSDWIEEGVEFGPNCYAKYDII